MGDAVGVAHLREGRPRLGEHHQGLVTIAGQGQHFAEGMRWPETLGVSRSDLVQRLAGGAKRIDASGESQAIQSARLTL